MNARAGGSVSADELEALPRVGLVKATAIVDYREANGPFDVVDDLDNVPGHRSSNGRGDSFAGGGRVVAL